MCTIKNHIPGLIDALLIGILVLYALSFLYHGSLYPYYFVLLPTYVILYLLAKFVFCCWYDIATKVVFCSFCVAGIYESSLCLLQIFGKRLSNNSFFLLTGTFDNPGPLGGFLAIVASCCVVQLLYGSKDKLLIFFSKITLCFCLLILPASMSRAALAGFLLTVFIFVIMTKDVKTWISSHWKISWAGLIVVVAMAIGAFALKFDSAIGRLHIWNIEARVIASYPILGVGPNASPGAFGEVQSLFFAARPRPEILIRVAGCPEYAFNEFLRIGMETGVLGLLVAFAVVLVAVKKLFYRHNPMAGGILAFSVFAFASYPFSVRKLSIVLTIMLAASSAPQKEKASFVYGAATTICSAAAVIALVVFFYPSCKNYMSARTEWKSLKSFKTSLDYSDENDDYEKLFPLLKDDYHFVYDYGYALHKQGSYYESNELMKYGSLISCDPLFHEMMGKNFYSIGDYENARAEYIKAYYMVPCRLYARLLLMRMELELGNTDVALKVASEIAASPVNERNMTMVQLRDEARWVVDSILVVHNILTYNYE